MSVALSRAIAELCDCVTDHDPTVDTSQVSTPLAALEIAILALRRVARRTEPSAEQRRRMLHAIGWWRSLEDGAMEVRRGSWGVRPTRNHYAADPDDKGMAELVDRGWMTCRGTGDDSLVYYHVTGEGFIALGLPVPTTETARARRQESP